MAISVTGQKFLKKTNECFFEQQTSLRKARPLDIEHPCSFRRDPAPAYNPTKPNQPIFFPAPCLSPLLSLVGNKSVLWSRRFAPVGNQPP